MREKSHHCGKYQPRLYPCRGDAARYPAVMESIATLEAEGFPIFACDGSLLRHPVICVVLFNPANGTALLLLAPILTLALLERTAPSYPRTRSERS